MSEPSASPTVRGAALTFSLNADEGVFHLMDPRTGAWIARDLECAVRLQDRVVGSAGSPAVWRPLPDTEGAGIEAQFGVEGSLRLALRVQADTNSGGLALTLRVSNNGPDLALAEARVLQTGAKGKLSFCENPSDASFFRNGWLDLDPAGASLPTSATSHSLESSLVGGVAHREKGDGLILGFAGAARQFTSIRLEVQDDKLGLVAAAAAGEARLERDQSLLTETLWLGYGPRPALLLLDFARFRTPAAPARRLPAYWDSWFVGYENTTEKQILESLDAARSRFPELDTFIVSDGYQKMHMDGPGVGDYLQPNDHFPHGMPWLAQQIRKRGLRPGIWTAPFLCGEKSAFYKYYPDALVRPRGSKREDWWETWRGDHVYYLDTTHADARSHIRDIYEQLGYHGGFEVFQVDFAYAAAVDGFRRDRTATPAEALDRGLELIRAAIGPDRTMLVTGAPIGAGSRHADAVSITPGIGPHWRGHCGTLSVLQAILNRSFLGTGTPAALPAPFLTQPDGGMTEDEFRCLATAVGLSGGPVGVSGPLTSLAPERAAILNRLIPSVSKAAVALDMFERSIPQLFGTPTAGPTGDAWLVAVFNTGDGVADRELRLAQIGQAGRSFHVFEYWGSRYLGMHNDTIVLLAMPAHSCQLLALHADEGRPQVISADDHIRQGADSIRRVTWKPAEGRTPARLHVELVHPGPTAMLVYLANPEGMLARTASARNGRARINREKSSGPLLAVETSFRDHCSFEVEY